MREEDGRYARFDIEEHTIDALELVLEKMRQARLRPIAWKWVVIGLHTALQGGFALVLRRSDGAQLLTKDLERKTYENWDRARETRKADPVFYDRVDYFLELYKKTLDPARMSYLGGSPFNPTSDQVKSIIRLNDERGSLTHFSAISWSVLVVNYLVLLDDLIPALRFFYFEAQPHAFLHHPFEEHAQSLLTSIEAEAARIRSELEKMPVSCLPTPTDPLDIFLHDLLRGDPKSDSPISHRPDSDL